MAKNQESTKFQLELNEAYQKVLLWFFSYPTQEITLSELVKNIEISKTTANRIVNRLVDEGFIRKKIVGKVWQLICNQKHPYNYTKRVWYNIMAIYGSGILNKIYQKNLNPKTIILFGSYRKGDDTEESDIDIAVEVADNIELKIEELGIISKLLYRKNVPVNIHIFSRNKIDLNLFANIANGIILEGFLEVRP